MARRFGRSADVTEGEAEDIYQRELQRVSRKFTHMRYHSFLGYFGVLKSLGWVEKTGEVEPSPMQELVKLAVSATVPFRG